MPRRRTATATLAVTLLISSCVSDVVVISTGGTFDCRYATTAADTGVDTIFNIGSVSKAFTAAAILDLVDAGTIALRDRAGGDLTVTSPGPAGDGAAFRLTLARSGS